MSFNLSGYKPEAPADSNFEPFKYEGPVRVNSARINQSEQASDYYGTPVGSNIFELEVEITEGEFAKRRLWKRFNLDTDKREGKKNVLPVEKLANQLFPLGLEFTDIEDLRACCEELVNMTPVIKAYRAKINKDEVQVWNIKGKSDKAVASSPVGASMF